MYVKILNPESGEMIYHCSIIEIRPYPDDKDGTKSMLVTIDGGHTEINKAVIELGLKPETELYIMNEEGKTVDRKVF